MAFQTTDHNSCENIGFIANSTFKYKWCGKFTSPNEEWMHMTRSLSDYELFVVTKGILYIGNHEQDFIVNTGQYLLMSPTDFQHGTKSSDCSFYWLHFYSVMEPDMFSSDTHIGIANTALHIPICGALPSLDRIKILMKQLQDSDRRYHDSSLNNHLCGAIIAELHCQMASTLKPMDTLSPCKSVHPFAREQLLEEIATYIGWHIQENLSIWQIAKDFGYNEKYLTTLFKQYYGVSLKQYQLQTKMEHAKASLSETNLPVSHIAYSLGFADAHNFSNAFRKVTGLSPSEYRSTYSKQNIFQV